MTDESAMRRSAVRIRVTYSATAFLFLGGAAFIGYALLIGNIDLAKDIFFAVMPVSASVISYWFAGRSAEKAAEKPADVVASAAPLNREITSTEETNE